MLQTLEQIQRWTHNYSVPTDLEGIAAKDLKGTRKLQQQGSVTGTVWGRGAGHSVMGLTWHCSEVEVLPDDLLKLAVHGAWSEALTQIQPEVLTQGRAWEAETGRERGEKQKEGGGGDGDRRRELAKSAQQSKTDELCKYLYTLSKGEWQPKPTFPRLYRYSSFDLPLYHSSPLLPNPSLSNKHYISFLTLYQSSWVHNILFPGLSCIA